MDYAEVVRQIRAKLSLSQTELAQRLGVSFATVNRWENKRCVPSPVAWRLIEDFCEAHHIPLLDSGEPHITRSAQKLTLYHGSKSGLHGPIAPQSRTRCDFGQGFYMGTERAQPLTLICNYPEARLYSLNLDLSGLTLLDTGSSMEWALLIAHHRGKMESFQNTRLYRHFADLSKGCDIIAGPIADDRMFVVLDRFFRGEITDAALSASLSALKLGRQYVAKTEKACRQIAVLEERLIGEEERVRLKEESLANRAAGIALAEEICRKHRRDGRFFDEILEAWEDGSAHP